MADVAEAESKAQMVTEIAVHHADDVELDTTEEACDLEDLTPPPTCCGIWRPCFAREPEVSKVCVAMFVLFVVGCVPGGIGGLISNIALSVWLLAMTVRSLFFHAPH